MNFLTAKVYQLYPRNIPGTDRMYNETKEFINLYSTLKRRIDKDYTSWKNLIEALQGKTLHVLDKTTFTANQPSFALELIFEKEAGTINALHIYYSCLIPYFYYAHTVHTAENHKTTKEISINNPEVFNHFETDVADIISEKFKIALFPGEYLDIKIPDISFEAIQPGNFTFRNAFFNTRYLFI